MSIEVTMRHSDVKIESLKEYAEARMAKLKEKFPKVTKVAIDPSMRRANLTSFRNMSYGGFDPETFTMRSRLRIRAQEM